MPFSSAPDKLAIHVAHVGVLREDECAEAHHERQNHSKFISLHISLWSIGLERLRSRPLARRIRIELLESLTRLPPGFLYTYHVAG